MNFFTLIFDLDHDFDILFCIYLNLKKNILSRYFFMVYVWYKLLKKIIPSSPYSTFNQDLCKDIILMLQYIVYALLSGQSCPMDIFLILSLNSNTVSIGVGTRGRGLSPPFFKSKVRHRRTITIIFFSKILINLAPPPPLFQLLLTPLLST